MLAALDVLRSDAELLLADGTDVATEFIEGRHVLQDEAHVRGLLFDALWSVGRTLAAFASRAEEEVRRWPDLDGDDPARRRGVEVMREALERRDAKRK